MQPLGAESRATFPELRDWAEENELGRKLSSAVPVLGMIVVLALVAAGIWVVWVVPQWQIERWPDLALKADRAKQLELEDALRKTLTQIVLGVFGLILLYFTWRRARAGDATVRIMEQGHITDRFTKAIEHLGALDSTGKPNIEVRLGAIYALERIALDSPRDHWTIMEILTAYVRQNAPNPPLPVAASAPESEDEVRSLIAAMPTTPRTEIQAILTVLRRRKLTRKRERLTDRLNLSNTWLRGALLHGSYLREADLSRANLQGASMSGADLQGALFIGTDLRNASMVSANLEGARLDSANLQGADMNGANLRAAYLLSANLERARFDRADLQGAVLNGANLEDAHMYQANLEGTLIYGVTLSEADEVKSARNWQQARYSDEMRKELGLTDKAAPQQ